MLLKAELLVGSDPRNEFDGATDDHCRSSSTDRDYPSTFAGRESSEPPHSDDDHFDHDSGFDSTHDVLRHFFVLLFFFGVPKIIIT